VNAEDLALEVSLPVQAQNAGYFVSRGQGIHPTRTIDSYEVIFVHAGRLGMRETAQEFDLGPGEFLLLLPGREHGGTRPSPPELRFYWIPFLLTEPQRRRRGPEAYGLQVPRQGSVADPDRLVNLFRRFLDDQEAGRLTRLSGGLFVLEILWALSQPAGMSPADAATGLAQRAEQHVRTRFHEPLNTAGIAQALRCNPDYLGRVFRLVYGRTLTEAIHRCRVQQARRELLDSARNIDEIARACGYEDVGYFRRIFRRQEGMSPRAFRRLYARTHVNTE